MLRTPEILEKLGAKALGVDSPKFRYAVKEILDNGAPVYERKQKPFDSRVVRMDDGGFFVVGDNTRMAAVDAAGKAVWTHPVEGWGVQAIASAKTPWYPGQVVAQFDVIGHETATVGDLGEFFVTNTNCGTWHVWTAAGGKGGSRSTAIPPSGISRAPRSTVATCRWP